MMVSKRVCLSFLLAAALAFGLVATPALADCSVDHAFVNRQIIDGIFRPGRFAAVPPAVPHALALIVEGKRDEARDTFTALGKVPSPHWPNMEYAAIVLDARYSAWLLDDCPPVDSQPAR